MQKQFRHTPDHVLTVFEQTAILNPDAPVVAAHGSVLGYAELTDRMDHMVGRLLQLGAGPGSTVVLCLERSEELLMQLLGMFKTGAAYVPIDHTNSPDEIALMLEDTSPALILTDRTHRHLFPGSHVPLLLIEDIDLANGSTFNGPCRVDQNPPRYILFTSWGTDRPKELVIHKEPLSNLITSQLHTSATGLGA